MVDLDKQLATGLPKVTLIFGDEPLLVEESGDAVRVRAAQLGYERLVITAESSSDWDQLTEATQSMSLFSTLRLIDLRLPTGRPGELGGRALIKYCQAAPQDMALLIVCGRLDGRARQAKWCKEVERAALVIEHKPIRVERLPAWIRARAHGKGINLEQNAEAILAYYTEGNLLAAAQEIDKLALMVDATATVTAADVEQCITDNARFNIFALADHCLTGDARKALRCLNGLKQEGVEPVLVVWALAKQVRTLYCLANALEAGGMKAQLFRKYRIWTKQATVVNSALHRLGLRGWSDQLRSMARLDRVLKGRSAGNIWQEIERICMTISGHRVVA